MVSQPRDELSETSEIHPTSTGRDHSLIEVFIMHETPTHSQRLMETPQVFSGILCALVAALLAAPGGSAQTDKGEGEVSLTITSVERVQQFPAPPAPPRVFVVSAGAGHEMAVITLKVSGSVAFDDYKMTVGAYLVDAAGTRLTAVLSKPYKGGSQPEVWDKHVLVFSIKKGTRLKSLAIGEMTFDLSTL